MNPETFEILSRQIPFLGTERQEKLLRKKVAVIGAGGLGSFVSSLLARAGVGFVRVVDKDLVEESNLHRVVLYGPGDIGKAKSFVAMERLGRIIPEVRVQGLAESLNGYSARKLLAGFDLVVDCSDSMETRYVINKFCVKNEIPWVYGSVLRDEGFSSTFAPSGKPCFSCLYPERPRKLETSGKAGVISPVIGMIASWEVMEAIKVLTKLSRPNYSKLLRIALKKPRFEFLNLKPRKNCEVCG
jgi:molybdopterin/thiamine biosynthesis adenylyltransferase